MRFNAVSEGYVSVTPLSLELTDYKAVVEMDRGRVSFSIPTVIPDIGDTNAKGQTPLIFTANLIRGKF